MLHSHGRGCLIEIPRLRKQLGSSLLLLLLDLGVHPDGRHGTLEAKTR